MTDPHEQPLAPTPDAPTTPSLGRTLLAFTGIRVVLFLAVFGVCLVAGLETPISLVIGLGVSAVFSFALMGRQRDAIADGLIARSRKRSADQARRRAALDSTEG
jgi:hypothetical protein